MHHPDRRSRHPEWQVLSTYVRLRDGPQRVEHAKEARTLLREALHGVRRFVAQLFAQGQSCAEGLERLMPA